MLGEEMVIIATSDTMAWNNMAEKFVEQFNKGQFDTYVG